MTIRRFLLAAFALALLVPASGCGCRRDCNRCSSSSLAAPPCCPDRGPAGLAPSVLP